MFSEFRQRDLRLSILKSLNLQPGYMANENILRAEAEAVGLRTTREVIRNELRFLATIHAVTIKEMGSVMIGTLTQNGQNHVEGLIQLEGVNVPSPGA